MSRVVSITLGLLGGWHKPGSGVRRRDEQIGSVVHLNCIALPHDARISYYALPFKRSTDPCYHCPEDEAFPDSLWGGAWGILIHSLAHDQRWTTLVAYAGNTRT